MSDKDLKPSNISPKVQVVLATSMLSTLVLSKFYGEIVFKFEGGNIVHIRQIKNMKIQDEARRAGVSNVTIAGRSSSIPAE